LCFALLLFEICELTLRLEVEEDNNDVSTTIKQYAKEKGLLPIPQAHVTAIYGMVHLSEEDVRARFREFVTKQRFSSWPSLKPVGLVVDVELDGIDGGLMVR